MRNFHLPSIRTLKLHSFHRISEFVNPLFPHLRPILRSLTTFSLNNITIHTKDLLNLLQGAPNLIDLEFAGSGNVDYALLFKSLSYVTRGGISPEPLLPKLERFFLHVQTLEFGLQVTSFPTDSFVDLIKSRWLLPVASTATTGTLSRLSELTFSARNKLVLKEVEVALFPCCDEGLVGTFEVITGNRWGVEQLLDDIHLY